MRVSARVPRRVKPVRGGEPAVQGPSGAGARAAVLQGALAWDGAKQCPHPPNAGRQALEGA